MTKQDRLRKRAVKSVQDAMARAASDAVRGPEVSKYVLHTLKIGYTKGDIDKALTSPASDIHVAIVATRSGLETQLAMDALEALQNMWSWHTTIERKEIRI